MDSKNADALRGTIAACFISSAERLEKGPPNLVDAIEHHAEEVRAASMRIESGLNNIAFAIRKGPVERYDP